MKRYFFILIIYLIAINSFASWQQTPGGDAYALSFMTDISSSKMLAGVVAAGLWMSENGGLSWEPINYRIFDDPFVGIDNIFFLDAAGDTIIISCYDLDLGSTTYISVDGGISWFLIDEIFANPGYNSEFVIVDECDHDILYYINHYYFAKSENFGETWIYWPIDGNYANKTGFYQYPDNRLFFSSYYFYQGGVDIGGVGLSADSGQSWMPIIPFYDLWGLTSAFIYGFIELSNGDWIATVCFTNPDQWEENNLVLSTDEGNTWERIGEGLPPRYQPDKIVEDPVIPGRLYIIGEQKYGLYVSDDYGRNWSRCLNGLPINVSICGDLEVNPFNDNIYVTIDSYGIYRTSDHGEIWETIPMPPVGLNARVSVFESSIFCRDYGYRLWRLDEPYTNLVEMELPLSPDTLTMFRPISYQGHDTLVAGLWKRPFLEAVDFFQMAYSYDNGESWQFNPFLPFLANTYFYTYYGDNVVRFITVGSNDSIWVTTDLGQNWNAILYNGYVNSIGQNETDIFISNGDDILCYEEENDSWIPLGYNGPPIDDILNVIGEDIYLDTWESPVSYCWCYHDSVWEQRGEMDRTICYNLAVPVEDDTIFFAVSMNSNLAWISEDYGYNWEVSELELPWPEQTCCFYNIKYDPYRNMIWASTGAGLCYLEVEQLAVDKKHLRFKPVSVSTLDIYPNPFNPSTVISFELRVASFVKLVVYDVQGREVVRLVDGWKTAGRYEVSFDASQLSSGVYFAKFKAGDLQRTRKLLLVK